MFRRGFWRMGMAGLEGSVNADGVTVLAKDSSDNVILCSCATGSIPSGTAGYALGCILINTTTGVLHSNAGTTAACGFTGFYGATGSTQ